MLWAAYCVFCEFKSVREKSWEKAELRKAEKTMSIIIENKDDIARLAAQILFETERNFYLSALQTSPAILYYFSVYSTDCYSVVPVSYLSSFSFCVSNNICAASRAISSLFSMIILMVFSAFRSSAFSHDF